MKKLMILAAVATLMVGASGCRCWRAMWRGEPAQPCAPVVAPCNPCPPPCDPCSVGVVPGPMDYAPGPAG